MGDEKGTSTDEYFLLEDWKMTKDRIKHFDDVVIRIRVQAIPISSVFFIAGWGLFREGFGWASWLFILAAIYILPIAVLDYFHYNLLVKAVRHAIDLEQNKFHNKLQITQKLTSRWLTFLHSFAALGIYSAIFIAALYCFNATI